MTAAQPTAREQRLHCALCANPAVLHRDGHRCIECGATEDLHVHHIEPMTKSANNDPSNLVTLCESCHAAAHRHPSCKSKKREHKEYIQSLPPASPFFMQRSPRVYLLVIPPDAAGEHFPFVDGERVTIQIEGEEIRISRAAPDRGDPDA